MCPCRPYFELKAAVNQQLEAQKQQVRQLEESVGRAKMTYSQALANLETISDEIHRVSIWERVWGVRKSGRNETREHTRQCKKEWGRKGIGISGRFVIKIALLTGLNSKPDKTVKVKLHGEFVSVNKAHTWKNWGPLINKTSENNILVTNKPIVSTEPAVSGPGCAGDRCRSRLPFASHAQCGGCLAPHHSASALCCLHSWCCWCLPRVQVSARQT